MDSTRVRAALLAGLLVSLAFVATMHESMLSQSSSGSVKFFHFGVAEHQLKGQMTNATRNEIIMALSQTSKESDFTCKSESDCGLAGDCRGGKCDCDAAWTGPTCTRLALLPTDESSGMRRASQSSWGGSVVKADGLYHMYFADMVKGCGLDQWQGASQIKHAVSKKAVGPYEEKGVVRVPFAHNPTVHRTKDGHFVIYHIASDLTRSTHKTENCEFDFKDAYNMAIRSGYDDMSRNYVPFPARRLSSEEDQDQNVPVLSVTEKADQTNIKPGTAIGVKMLVAKSPYGPWEIRDEAKGTDGKCNNPAALHNPDGTVLLYCKMSGKDVFKYGVFKAESWEGPFKFVQFINGDLGAGSEDPYVFYSEKRDAYHMIYHRQDRPPSDKRPSTAWSKDGMNWQALHKPHTAFDGSIELTNGKVVQTNRRERHQLVFNDDGEPVALFNGVTTGALNKKNGLEGYYSYTAAVPIRSDKSHKLALDSAL